MPTLQYGPDATANLVDIYPMKGSVHRGDVLVIPGGGWQTALRGGKSASIANDLAKAGFRASVLSYRCAPTVTWPAIMDDIRLCIAYLTNYFTYRPYPWKSWGWSAGGHMGQWLANDGTVVKHVNVSGPADLNFIPTDKAEALCPDHDYNAASPVFHISPNCSPSFLMYGTKDPEVNYTTQGEALKAALVLQSVPYVWKPYNGGHCWDNLSASAQSSLKSAAFNWLKT